MAIATSTLIAAGVAGAGAVAGSMGQKSSSTSGIRLDPASQREIGAGQALDRSFADLQGLVNAGPGLQDVTAGTNASRDLAAMFERASREGGMNPTAGDISQSNSLAGALFGQQRVGLQQGFEEATRSSNAQAALMGRDPNDPILRARLMQAQMNQTAQLDATQGSFAMQNAMAQPGQRLNLAGQRASILGGLATQAMANRQAIAAMGSQIQESERNFRLATGTRWGEQKQGGGLQGALTGALGGLGAGMSAGGAFANMNLSPPSPAVSPPAPASGLGRMNFNMPANQFWGMQPMNPFGASS